MGHVVVEKSIGSKALRIETGKLAKQAAGAVVVTVGETVVLAAVAAQDVRPDQDFFPLMVDYRERGYSVGKIFGGRFLKREGRPSDKETLTMRLIDRPIRPLWPEGYMKDVVIQCMVLSSSPSDVDPDILAMIAASAALSISSLPFQGPLGAVRVGMIEGNYVVNPSNNELKTSRLDLVVAGTQKAVLMVESGADELTEDQMTGAIEYGHGYICKIVEAIEELVAQVKPVKETFVSPIPHPINQVILNEEFEQFKATAWTAGKFSRSDARKALAKSMVEKYGRKEASDESKPTPAEVKAACDWVWERTIRTQIKLNKRCDSRDRTSIRPIDCEVGILPRAHGSALFTRGETQALVIATLGTGTDAQLIETLEGEVEDRFMLHYNFPGFSVGEAKAPRGPGRREIGHGALARRAIKPLLPDFKDFPYTLRIVSEILESNGSSSMATVCGGTLALLDAGVPLKKPVAGIAMGLVEEDGEACVISDILGDEDHYGDMDFKVAGSAEGITALQMDLKSCGISFDVMRKALYQAKEGRLHVLKEMAGALSAPRDQISPYAPKIVQLQIAVDKIGKLIGPGGKTIRMLEEKHGVKIEVSEEGMVTVASPLRDQADNCAKEIEGIAGNPEIGRIYQGEVVNIREFGVFLEILPGLDGLCHVSELDINYIKNTAEFCKVGDKLEVKLIAIDDLGRLKLSRKALLVERQKSDDNANN